MLGPWRRQNHLENGRWEELMPYNVLFLTMWSWNQIHYDYHGCWFWKLIYEAQDSALLIHTPEGNSSPSQQSNQTRCERPLSFSRCTYVYWLRAKFNKVEGKDIRGGKKKEKESILLLILDLIFLSFPHPTYTNIPHKTQTASFLVNMNFKK